MQDLLKIRLNFIVTFAEQQFAKARYYFRITIVGTLQIATLKW